MQRTPRLGLRIRFLLGGIAATLLVSLSACGAELPTCEEFAQMAPDTGNVLTRFTDEQDSAVKAALRRNDYQEYGMNTLYARESILSYCAIGGGQAGANHNEFIDASFN